MPRPRVGSNLDKPKDFKHTTKKLINTYLAKYKFSLISVINLLNSVGVMFFK